MVSLQFISPCLHFSSHSLDTVYCTDQRVLVHYCAILYTIVTFYNVDLKTMLFLCIVEVTAAADSILGPLMDLLDGKQNREEYVW